LTVNRHPFLQQGAPALRDLCMIAIAGLLALAATGSSRRHDALLTAAAFVAGATLFWTYNRGTAAVALVGVYAVAGSVAGRSPRAVLLAASGGLAGLAAVFALSPNMFAAHISSILYWRSHDGIWHLPRVEFKPLLIGLACCAAMVGAGVVALGGLRNSWLARADARLPALALALALSGMLVFYGSLNRLDEIHAYMSVPYALLAMIGAAAAWEPGPGRVEPALALRLAVPALAFGAAVVLAQGWISRAGLAGYAQAVIAGLRSDRQLADPNYVKVADIIRASGSRCTVALDNQSLINHLAGLRPCTRFLVPVYAQGDAEPRMLAELQEAPPAMLVLRSTSWSYAIDGIDQATRTPKLMAWARANYVPVADVGGIIVAKAAVSAETKPIAGELNGRGPALSTDGTGAALQHSDSVIER
jgi:hypothetical protein